MIKERLLKREIRPRQSFENMLRGFRRRFFRLIFALAIASKVTPKRLATAMDKDKTQQFADKLVEEINKIEEKEAKQNEEKMTKLRTEMNAVLKKHGFEVDDTKE